MTEEEAAFKFGNDLVCCGTEAKPCRVRGLRLEAQLCFLASWLTNTTSTFCLAHLNHRAR